MTDVQVLTLAVAVIVPLSLLIYSNSRISDVRLSLDSKLNDAKETLRAEAKTQHTEVMARLTAIDTFLHEAVMSKLDEMDRRLTALESRP
jgi:hypothetical protein